MTSGGIRVCRVVADYPVGGKPTYGLQPNYYYLSKKQVDLGYDVQVVAHRKPGQPQHEICDGIEIHRLEAPFSLNAVVALQRLLRGTDSGVVHTHATAGYFLSLSRRLVDAPLVSHVHGATRSAFHPVPLRFGETTVKYSRRSVYPAFMREKLLWRSADRVLAVSSRLKEDLVVYYGMPSERISVVYNGIDETIFRPVDGASAKKRLGLEGKRVVLYVGHFGPRKGLLHLMKTMQIVTAEAPDAVLLCIGGVPAWMNDSVTREYQDAIKGLLEKSGLRNKTFMLDRVPNAQLPSYYSAADVFVLPSYYEAFAKVLIEAMACERPVVATRMGGNLDAIMEGETGLLAEYGNEHEFAEAILTIFGNPKAAEAMARKGRERVLANFTWSAVAERIGAAYKQVLEGRASVPGAVG